MTSTLDRSAWTRVFEDDFTGPALDPFRWVDHYLPHWSTPEGSAARYRFDDGLVLLVEVDQPAWRPQEEAMRVSNVQTGTFSGPLDSPVGQHRHRDDLRVTSPQPTRALWTPSAGLVEVTARASADPTCMLGIWLVGLEEDSSQQSGEVCVAELFGNAVGPGRSAVRTGVKAHHDPALVEDVIDVVLDLDATDWHTYAAAWDAGRTEVYVDDVLIRSVDQGIDYPQQLMIDLFEFPESQGRAPADYPKLAHVSSVRGYRRSTPGSAQAPASGEAASRAARSTSTPSTDSGASSGRRCTVA